MIAEMEPEVVEHVYCPMGGADELWDCTDPDVLMDGPAGTGKSRAWLEVMVRDAINYPGSRQAMVRKTRVSLTDSALVTFETKVLGGGLDTCYLKTPLLGGPTRGTRHSYLFTNGSEIACHGMDNPTRLFSTEYDRIYVQEATELVEAEWESLHRALRNNMMPYQQLGGDCNPDAEDHWLNVRCDEKRTRRILSRHSDNPSLSQEYLDRLSRLTGVRRSRLYLGLWVSAEGQIWENFDRARHVPAYSLHTEGQEAPDISKGVPAWRRWWLEKPDGDKIELLWFFAVVDWGHRNPGCLQVFGVDSERRAYRIRELYCQKLDKYLWAEYADLVRRKFNIQTFICDAADSGSIALFNQRMGSIGGEPIARPCVKQPNDFEPTASIVRERFADMSLYLIADANDQAMSDIISARDGATDPERKQALTTLAATVEANRRLLAEETATVCTEKEIPSYVYRKIKDHQAVKEEPAPDSINHGCDCLRYGMKFLDQNDWSPYQKKSAYPARSMGDVLGHADVRRKKRDKF